MPCPACGASQNTTPPPPPATAFATRTEVVYAGFFRRWLALWVDGLILGIPLGIVAVIAAIGLGIGSHGKPDDAANLVGVLFEAVFYPLYWIAAALYFSLQESSRHQATLGKRLLGIKVTDLAGNRLTFGHAIGRWFAAALSYLTLYIGFLVAAFTAKKQALHDFVAGTLKANAKLMGKRIWLELDSGSNTWQCSSEIENRYLPQTCRQ